MAQEVLYCYRDDNGARLFSPSFVVAARRNATKDDITYIASKLRKSNNKKK